MSARPAPRLLQVLRNQARTPRMRRVTLGGAALAGFPPGSEGAHIKLLFPSAPGAAPALPELTAQGPRWPAGAARPQVRTYTVAAHDASAQTLDVDLVVHAHGGCASAWAQAAQPGDAIGLIGPGGPPLYRPQAARYLLIGDPSSYALVHAVMRKLPAQALGDVLMEVPHADEIQPLPPRERMRVQWLSDAPGRLLAALRALPWPPGEVSATLAGESGVVVAARNFLVGQRGVPRSAMYAVPYWRRGSDEDAYHDERHRLMDAFADSDEAAA
ncbi:siderophore-interacting protein [Lysobacter silvisoli]|uniref:Siderophore-interacting protein n=1 Tax=Lysobacter silvisoli TaxID=2293254 RepID=A0A371JZR9_9GAMM|nr:siderophore-interacting protein [Lysobacter silvisoli]RDZ27163.1 siderophore-interacting protein [Lysobacter silvisoli]